MSESLPVVDGESRPLPLRSTREVKIGSCVIGGSSPIAVQSMCATKTTDLKATAGQIELLERAGVDILRLAIDSKKEVEALKILRRGTSVNLVVDLQENYRLAEAVAPFVQKLRYNPGHLHHHQREVSVEDKVKYLVEVASANDCAVRVGVNFGSLDPALKSSSVNPEDAAVKSASDHCEMIEALGFSRFVVSLKSSDPLAVVRVNKEFAKKQPKIPIHLGVTEAGMLPDGEIKTRIAFEQLLPLGIGDTVRVSLTLPDNEKNKEVEIARAIIDDVQEGRFRSVPEFLDSGLNVISCPSCSRVENSAFVQLAREVKDALSFAKEHSLTVAVMGCRVNGPGETDDADLGLWCAPTFVNLKRGSELVGKFRYEEVVGKLVDEIEKILAERQS